ncbi:MAG: 2-keto-4-pentenoate hydratase [Deinococcota bacterium]
MNPSSEKLLEAIHQARRTKTVLTTHTQRELTLEQAYAIQSQGFAGRTLKGYKLGLVSRAKQQQMGLDHPIYGRISPEMLLESPVQLADFLQPRIEPEVAVVLKDDLAPTATPGQAMKAVGGFFIGIDVLDSVWAGYRFSASEVVADNASGGAFLIAAKRLGSLPSGTLRLWLNGDLLTEGPVEALGDPYVRLAWLAGSVGGLEAGQVVFLGSPATAVPAGAGVLELTSEGGCLSALLV